MGAWVSDRVGKDRCHKGRSARWPVPHPSGALPRPPASWVVLVGVFNLYAIYYGLLTIQYIGYSLPEGSTWQFPCASSRRSALPRPSGQTGPPALGAAWPRRSDPRPAPTSPRRAPRSPQHLHRAGAHLHCCSAQLTACCKIPKRPLAAVRGSRALPFEPEESSRITATSRASRDEGTNTPDFIWHSVPGNT